MGRHIATAAVGAGWRVTVLNNDTGPSRAPPGATRVFADRLDAGEMSLALQGRHWDAVIDTWRGPAIAPQISAGLLCESDTIYCLISCV